MSTNLQSLLNGTSLSFFRKNPVKGIIGDMLFSSKMKLVEDKKADSLMIATDNGEIELSNLADNAMLAFDVTIITIGHSSNFSHNALKSHNETSFEKESRFTVFYNGETIVMQQTTHLGETIDSAQVASLLSLGIKLGSKAKTIAKWRKRQGSYEKLVSGEWQAMTTKQEKSVIESAIESGETLLTLPKKETRAEKKARLNAEIDARSDAEKSIFNHS